MIARTVVKRTEPRFRAAFDQEQVLFGGVRSVGLDGTTVLTVYLVLLLIVPSAMTFTMLGSIGHPATLWALGALLWWCGNAILHYRRRAPGMRHPVRIIFGLFVVVVLISYSRAMIGGLPGTETTTATSGLISVASWAGVFLVAHDGVTSFERLRTLTRRFVFLGGLLALLGLVQFATKKAWITLISVPLMSMHSPEVVGLSSRSGFVRVSGTASHPLEYAAVLCAVLPFAIILALGDKERSALRRWTPVVLLALVVGISLSRSAIVGALVAGVSILPALSARARVLLISIGVLLIAGVVVAVPGMAGTVISMFSNLSSNPSITSRTTGVGLVMSFVMQSPVFGKSYGTFLPEYYIFDNAYLLMTTELGILGLAVFVALILGAVFSALRAKKRLASLIDRQLAHAVAAGLLACCALLAFFDGLSFPQAAGTVFFLLGIAGTVRRLSRLQARAPHDVSSCGAGIRILGTTTPKGG